MLGVRGGLEWNGENRFIKRGKSQFADMVMLASAAARNERAPAMFISGQNKLALEDDPGLRELIPDSKRVSRQFINYIHNGRLNCKSRIHQRLVGRYSK